MYGRSALENAKYNMEHVDEKWRDDYRKIINYIEEKMKSPKEEPSISHKEEESSKKN